MQTEGEGSNAWYSKASYQTSSNARVRQSASYANAEDVKAAEIDIEMHKNLVCKKQGRKRWAETRARKCILRDTIVEEFELIRHTRQLRGGFSFGISSLQISGTPPLSPFTPHLRRKPTLACRRRPAAAAAAQHASLCRSVDGGERERGRKSV